MQNLRRNAAVRECCVFAKATKDSAFNTKVVKCRGAVPREFLLWHSIAHRRPGSAIRSQQDVIRSLQQRDFCGRFEHPTAGRDWSGADKLKRRRFLVDAVEQKEADAFFNSYLACADSAIAKNFGDSSIRTRVFFPGSDINAEFD